MFRFPYAIQYYIEHKGWVYAAKKAKEFATQVLTEQELQWFMNYCRKLPHRWEEKN